VKTLAGEIRVQPLLEMTWNRPLLEELIVIQLVKEFPTFCRTQRFITASQEPATVSYPVLWVLLKCRPVSRPCVTFHNMIFVYREGLFASAQRHSTTPYRPSVTAYSVNFQLPHYLEAISSIRNLRTCHAVLTRDSLNMRICHSDKLLVREGTSVSGLWRQVVMW